VFERDAPEPLCTLVVEARRGTASKLAAEVAEVF
jgi:hypothetical protein